MYYVKGILTCCFIFILTGVFAQREEGELVTLEGVAAEYAGMDLTFQTIINPITKQLVELTTIRIDKKGRFEHQFPLTEITYALVDVGRFRASIYLEPGQRYEVVLPPFEPRSDADRFNPFFTPEDVPLGIANEESWVLNRLIYEFEYDFNERYNTSAYSIFQKRDKARVEAIISELDSIYPAEKGSFFEKVKHNNYAKLDLLVHKRNEREVINSTYVSNDLDTNIPAFSETFNTLFKNFFSNYFKSMSGDSLRIAYDMTEAFDTLSMVMSRDTLFADVELRELVLLKGLYDAFYSGIYDEEKIIRLLENAKETAVTDDAKSIASDLYTKVTWLRTGSEAPDFRLYRLDGKERSLERYRGRFVYLNFIHSENHACKQDLQRLKVIYEKMRREVVILTIVMDEDPTAFKKVIKDNKFKWDFLHFSAQPGVYFDYNLKALPTYFLIDPDGKLRLTPAPAPGESFVPVFQEAVIGYKYDQLRKSKPKARNIYDM